jgi:hypothetical protein
MARVTAPASVDFRRLRRLIRKVLGAQRERDVNHVLVKIPNEFASNVTRSRAALSRNANYKRALAVQVQDNVLLIVVENPDWSGLFDQLA